MKILNCQELGKMCSYLLDGEPVFIVRAKDELALDIVKEYKRRAEFHKTTNTTRVQSAINDIEQWQKDNPTRVRRPD